MISVPEINEVARTSPELVHEGEETLQALLARSATDWEFRSRLVADPRAAVAEFTGRAVSETFNVVFVENTVDATIVLPDPVDPAAELSEADLEAVAGGATPVVVTVLSVIASAIALTRAIARDD
jgi:hypothetical protein